jgi:guanylate kinase
VDGVDYHFITKAEFHDMSYSDDFVECAEVYGNFYGTAKAAINDILLAGKFALLVVDVQGALWWKRFVQGVKIIFITYPSLSILRKQLELRGDSADEIEHRLYEATIEDAYATKFDHFVVNDILEDAVWWTRWYAKREKVLGS